MAIAIKGLLALFWLVAVPFAAGIPFLQKKQKCVAPEYLLVGYLVLFSVTEVLTLFVIWRKLPLHLLTMGYGGISLMLAAVGIFCFAKNKRHLSDIFTQNTSVYFWMAVLVIVLQTVMCVFLAHMDADDCMYVANATTSVHTDTIFQINPYTGREYTRLPERYVLSPFPVFLAVVSQLSAGLHPAIMAHMIFPAVFLPVCYMVQYLLGRKWFGEVQNAVGIYLFLVALITGFSAYSVYNAGCFQMVRIWQGKALLAGMLLPAVFYLSMCIYLGNEKEYSWLLLGMADMSCCLLSSMGVILAPLVAGCFLIVSLITNRNIHHVWKTLLCFIPSVILGGIYIWIS